MEMKDTLSSCPDSKEQEMQQMRIQAKSMKHSSMNTLTTLKTTIQHLSNKDFLENFGFKRAFYQLFGDINSSGFVSDKWNAHSSENDCSQTRNDQSSGKQSNTSRNESSRSRNECNERSNSRDDTDTRPSYDTDQMDEVPYTAEYNVFDVETQHTEQPENMNDTSLMEKADNNTTPDS
nr:hypothetical protein [Tanacetum cinerariifolium]